MSNIKYVILLCVLFVACKNEAKVASQTTRSPEIQSTLETPKEEAKSEVSIQESNEGIEDVKMDTVTVSNLEDLVENAKSNTVLILEKGTYKLDQDLVYKMTKEERVIIDKKKVETRSIGGQLHFSGFNNFHIKGQKGTIIQSENPKAVPFFILKSKNVKVSNLTITKKVEGDSDMFYASGCRDIEVDNCTIDGGGAYGFYTNGVDNMTISNSTITKCTVGALKAIDSRGLKYTNCTITKNFTKVALITLYGSGSVVTFHGVKIIDNKRNADTKFTGSEKIFTLGFNNLRVDNCVIRNNEGFTHLGVGQNFLNRTEIDGVIMQ